MSSNADRVRHAIRRANLKAIRLLGLTPLNARPAGAKMENSAKLGQRRGMAKI